MEVILSPLQSGLMEQVTVYPNPFISKISLEITSLDNKTAIVSLLNSQERIIKMFSWNVKAGMNKTSINGLGSLPAGTYRLVLKETNGTPLHDTKITKE